MGYGMLPLYPPNGECGCRDNCVRVPLFGGEPPPVRRDGCCGCRTVRLENPCRHGEYAEVELSVDSCGNLVICVHRDVPRCMPPRRPY